MQVNKIKVLIIDDSALFREYVSQALSSESGIEVVGTASDPIDAREKLKVLEPDVLALDVEMPKMNGIDFLKNLMAKNPIPTVVVSSVSSNVFDALDAGAVDFVTKPSDGSKKELFILELLVKIRIASCAKIKRLGTAPNINRSQTLPSRNQNLHSKDLIIAIGASTGGTEAILSVVRNFPKDMPGVVVVQHMPAKFTKMYADRIDKICNMEVREAKNGDYIKSGTILIAPGELQMKVKRDSNGFYVQCAPGEKVSGHAPSVDVLFNSVAEVATTNSVGVILTGMGSDGAKGLLNMKNKGAYTIGQDEQSSVVYGMPRVSYNIGAVKKQASLSDIPDLVMKHINSFK